MPHKRAKRSIRTAETAKKGQNLPPKTLPSSSSSSSAYAYDDTPRLGARILNSHKVQTAFHASGRVSSEDTGERRPKSKSNPKSSGSSSSTPLNAPTAKGKGKLVVPKIMANESLGDYNRRVEAFMRPGVSQAIKDAASIKASQERAVREEKKARRLEAKEARLKKEGKGSESPPPDSLEPASTSSTTTSHPSKKPKTDDKPHHQPTSKPKDFAPIPAPRRLNDIVQAPPTLPHLRRSKTQTPDDANKSAFKATGRNPLSAGQARLMEVERERVVGLYREMKAKRAVLREEEEGAKTGKGKGKGKGEKRKREVEGDE